jgi:alkylation response protein AidB-like acyl-CoA dehydrogenase
MGNNYYRVNKRDIDFVLNEQLKVEQVCELEAYKDFDADDFDMIISEAIKFATEVLGPLNQDADRVAAKYEDGKVKAPEAFHEAYKLFCENGWLAMSNSAELGGQGLPGVIAMAAGEIFFGGCTSFMLYFPGPGVGHMVENFASDKLKETFCEKLYTGEWQGTMCLTEPGAGTAVGDLRTTAKKDGDTYLLSGTKCFITAGDHDLTPNIIHGVLARVEGAPPGTKGISQFIVPKYWVNEDGSQGEFNNVTCAGIEHKMGIKASATCTLNRRRREQRHAPDVPDDERGPYHDRAARNRAGSGRLRERRAIHSRTHPGRRRQGHEGSERAARPDHEACRRSPHAAPAEILR